MDVSDHSITLFTLGSMDLIHHDIVSDGHGPDVQRSYAVLVLCIADRVSTSPDTALETQRPKREKLTLGGVAVVLVAAFTRCRRVFLQAPAGTHGAGVAFHSTGVPDRGADFLVAVTSARKVEGAVAWRTVRTKTSWPGFNTPKTRKETHDSTSRQDDRTTLRFALSESSESIRPWEATHQNRYDCRGGADWNRARKIQERCADAVREVQAPLLSLTNDNAATTLTASDLHNSVLHFSRRLASLVGGRRRQGPGPGAAVWTVGVVRGRETSDRPYRPKAAKLQRLAQHLEAGLKLRGQPGTGGLPSVPSQRIDMPYTRELAKWGYDEILGIPLTTVSSQK